MTFHELRYAIRSLRRSPGYSLPAALALAIGIGANTALFSVVSAVLLKPLPYPRSSELVALEENIEKFHQTAKPLSTVEYGALRSYAKSYRAIGAYETIQGEVLDGAVAETLPGVKVTASVFDVLQVAPQIGVLFGPEQDFDGSDAVVISDKLRKRRFGSDPSIAGHQIETRCAL